MEDELWKGVLEDSIKDFLIFMSPDAEDIFDFDRGIEMLDKELLQLFKPEDGFISSSLTDKLFKIYTKDGQEQFILIHIEVQNDYRKIFNLRMFLYFIHIFSKHKRPIIAYAILTEPNKKVRPDTFRLSFMGTELTYKYNVLKLSHLDDTVLMASKNIFAWVALFAKASFEIIKLKDTVAYDKQLMEIKKKLYRHLLNNDFNKNQIAVLEDFLTYYVNFQDSKNNLMFHRRIFFNRPVRER